MAKGDRDVSVGDIATLRWDGDTIRLRYKPRFLSRRERRTRDLAAVLGERSVPVEALRAVSTEPVEDGVILRLLLRDDADPLLVLAGDAFDEEFDPYRIHFSWKQWETSEWRVKDLEADLARSEVAGRRADRWLVEPPEALGEFKAFDARLTLRRDEFTFHWDWKAFDEKQALGMVRKVMLADITAVEWRPPTKEGLRIPDGYLRITTVDSPPERPPPYSAHASHRQPCSSAPNSSTASTQHNPPDRSPPAWWSLLAGSIGRPQPERFVNEEARGGRRDDRRADGATRLLREVR